MNTKRWKSLIAAMLAVSMLAGCGGDKKSGAEDKEEKQEEAAEPTPEPTPTPTPSLIPEDQYFSELTGLPISKKIQNQKPIAVMIDNEWGAYNHFGVAEADIVYEMINSEHNERITRLMAIYKDYDNVKQIGSVRSTRHTNLMIQAEYNYILCHDGEANGMSSWYYEKPWALAHIPGGFSRIRNGKAWEFTEYILPGDVDKRREVFNITKEYNRHKPDVDSHFNFVEYKTETMTDDYLDTATNVDFPFPHNHSKLVYNPETKTYDYYCYGMLHVDGEDNEVLSFKNVLIQNCEMEDIDDNGHVLYHVVGTGIGYYLSNGHVQSIIWNRENEAKDITRYYDMFGKEIEMNRGNTYIALVPSDSWEELQVYDPSKPAEEEAPEEETEEVVG